jgi:hypothetical protein
LFLFTELLAFITLALDVVPAIAWWTLKKGHRHARAWALAASVVNLLPLPSLRRFMYLAKLTHLSGWFVGALVGAAGLLAFSRRRVMPEVSGTSTPKPQRLPGDGTSKAAERIAGVLGIAWLFLCFQWWRTWARTQHLSQSDFLIWIVEIQIAVLICVAIHELGHVLAGWASDMKLRSFQVGPFHWFHKRGKWKFKLVPRMGGGVTGMAPTRLTNVRGRSAFFTLGGPVASLVLAGVGCIACLTAKGHFWEGSWSLLSMIATIGSVDFMVNLIPQKPEANYSDGARIYQLVTNGPWAHVEQAFSMVASTLVTSRRPRDYDIEVIRSAGNFLERGDRGMLLRLYSCMHYLDTGQIAEAVASLQEAEPLYEGTTLQSPAGICAVFVFVNGIFKRDRAAAELWWKRLEAQRGIDFDAEYWQARTAILWLQGESDDAQQAWERGYALAMELPAAGAYEYTRWGFDALRDALNEPSPVLAEMLAGITSDEASAEVCAVTDPVL